MSSDQLRLELQPSAKIVCCQYCVSLWVITFRRSSHADYFPAGESRVAKGLPWTLLTLVLGWWGIPWGPIFTAQSLITNFKGGKDLTADFSAPMTRRAVPAPGPIPAAK
jgi:hypothetical protein